MGGMLSCPGPGQSEHQQQFPAHSTVLRQHRQCARFRQIPTLPVSLPRFATQDVALDIALSLSVATQLYPSSPGSRSSTPCFDLADLDSECSRAAMSSSPVSDVMPVVPVVRTTGGL